MSADDELGYVYLPFSTPSNDYYGGQRPGDGLFGESLVCLDARTGKRVWHFQMVHHGLWDYDPPAAPNLIDVRVNGQPVKAVAQVSKQGFVYVFDRVTGRPIWPIEERPVPQSTVPGEKSSRTQPFPTKPAPFDRQGVTEDDVIDFTPELRKEALAVLGRNTTTARCYTPPSLEKPTIQMPGMPEARVGRVRRATPRPGRLYVTSITNPIAVTLANRPVAAASTTSEQLAPMETIAGHAALETALRAHHRDRSQHGRAPVDGADGRSGERSIPTYEQLGLVPLGRATRGHTLLTKTLLIVGQEGTTQRAEGSASQRRPAFRAELPGPRRETRRLRQDDREGRGRGGASAQRDRRRR